MRRWAVLAFVLAPSILFTRVGAGDEGWSTTCSCGAVVSGSDGEDPGAKCAAACGGNGGPPAAGGAPAAGDGGGGRRATLQQMQLEAAQQLGAAAGQRFVQWLLRKPDDAAKQQQLALEQERQQALLKQMAEQQREQKAEAEAKFQAGKKDLQANLKGGSADVDLQIKEDDLHASFNRSEWVFHDRVHWDDYLRAGMDHQKALTKVDATNKPNEDWCHLHQPLFEAPDKEKGTWSCLCAADCGQAPTPAPDPDKLPLP